MNDCEGKVIVFGINGPKKINDISAIAPQTKVLAFFICKNIYFYFFAFKPLAVFLFPLFIPFVFGCPY
tara:strand:+ start:946 stop:1149 length:204 start_codon:yes stop_codon:yes gene_type:complete